MDYLVDNLSLGNDFEESDALLPFVEGDCVPQMVNIEFLNLAENMCFYKVQSRKGGTPKQVLEHALIEMKATYGPEPLLKIRGWIRREPDAAKLCNDSNKEVPLCHSPGIELNLAEKSDILVMADDPRYMSQLFSVDLGKIYEGPKHPVFQLARTDILARNRFQLLIQLDFLHREPSDIFTSPTFLCRTKPNKRNRVVTPPPVMEPPSHRPRTESTTSVVVSDPYSDSHTSPGSYPDSFSLGTPASPPTDLIVDTLKARTANIKDLVAENLRIETNNADIAYHLRIEDPQKCARLEEGDIVGFYTDPNDGSTFIEPLKGGGIGNAVHAGVISRSHYIAGHKPSDKKSATDTVCVIGIVNVKVVGCVQNGERIYASVNYPGKAIPQSHLPVGSFLRNRHFLLGMAMERKFSRSFEDAHLVKCFVCIVLDVNRREILDEMENLYAVTEMSLKARVLRAQRRTWKRLSICFGVLLVFVALLVFLLYQVLVPGSLFRYWMCRQGSIPDHDLRFTFVPFKDQTQEYHPHGILFTFNNLKKKIADHFFENSRNDTGGMAYYYLNVDRCAYNGDYGPVGNYIGGHKLIGGGKIFSINHNCTIVYYFGYNIDIGETVWVPYVSTKHLVCEPRPPFKTTKGA